MLWFESKNEIQIVKKGNVCSQWFRSISETVNILLVFIWSPKDYTISWIFIMNNRSAWLFRCFRWCKANLHEYTLASNQNLFLFYYNNFLSTSELAIESYFILFFFTLMTYDTYVNTCLWFSILTFDFPSHILLSSRL